MTTQQAEAEAVVVSSTPSGHPPDKMPAIRTIARTLDISVRFLAGAMRGNGTVEYADELLAGWSRDIFRYGAATLAVRGREHISSGEPYVVMSNHGSLLDVPALIATFPGSLRMVTKEELMRVPVWGKAMLGSGFIPINRKDRRRAIEQLELAKKRVSEGITVWIAPEGTRSRDGSLGPFKKGGFHLARQLGASIVPTYVHGADEALPPDSFVSKYDITITVHYGEPIPVPEGEDIDLQMARVRAAILALADGRLRDRAGDGSS